MTTDRDRPIRYQVVPTLDAASITALSPSCEKKCPLAPHRNSAPWSRSVRPEVIARRAEGLGANDAKSSRSPTLASCPSGQSGCPRGSEETAALCL